MKLYLALDKLENHKDVEEIHTSGWDDARIILFKKGYPDGVYLCVLNYDYSATEIFISENTDYIFDILDHLDELYDYQEIHFHYYSTYEDAYAVALDMRETNPLCYN